MRKLINLTFLFLISFILYSCEAVTENHKGAKSEKGSESYALDFNAATATSKKAEFDPAILKVDNSNYQLAYIPTEDQVYVVHTTSENNVVNQQITIDASSKINTLFE